jgi:IS30 family transposase
VRKLREILRLKAAGVSERQIAAAVGVVRSTVQLSLRRAREAGIDWSLAETLTEAELAGKRGPTPLLQKQIERLSRLPKAQQKVVLKMLDGVLSQPSR